MVTGDASTVAGAVSLQQSPSFHLRLVTVLQVLRMVSKGLERVPIRTDIDGQRWQECVSQHEDREQSDREPPHEASLVLLSQRDNQ